MATEGLAGDFGTLSFADLLQIIGNKGLTGTLTVEIGSLRKIISIKDGQALIASSTDPKEFFGRFLLNFGHVKEDELQQALQTQTETRIFLGKILVMIGLVKEETVKQVLSLKIRETMLDVFRWKAGTFRFERNLLAETPEAVDAPVAVLDIHREGEFRETAWQAMSAAFPHGGLALSVDPAKAPKEVPTGSFDEKMWRSILSGQTIDEMGAALGATDFYLYQRLYAMYRGGIVAPVEPTPRAPAAEPSPVGEELSHDEILGHAKEFLSIGLYSEAETLAVRAVEIRGTPEAVQVLKQAESGLSAKLRSELLASPMVPKLGVEPARFKDLDLSQSEKYLLSRIDGQRNIQAIVKASPLKELEALKYFRKLIDDGLILLRGG